MVDRLNGKVVLLTGAGGGLGAAQARLMAKEGATVMLANLPEDPIIAEGKPPTELWDNAQTVVKEIRDAGGKADVVALDVTKENQWETAVRKTVDTFGKLDVLVNNAGIYYHAGLLDHTVDKFHQIVNVNQLGVLLGMRAAVPAMKGAGGGSIINFASIYGISGAGVSTAYQSTKGAVRLMTKSAALEFVGDNIRINAICPGMFDTNLFESSVPREAWSPLVDLVPMKRFGKPDEIAYGVVFLASDESSFMTGADLVIDGGYTCP
ncbi:glucose 1-dehydrogenase [Pelagibius litoralis]|uniref:Glucose 1-dehydrogenase n=1 Tax=Pelagibius litoralis TaxID=374515 RepID=A0A967F1J3_9PROT|nr:glucose 1-dehydrogenase [Pelagibius litoralis]NIA71375.1 glucose 1-dehydrogenase [Pelagibius litoralis]